MIDLKAFLLQLTKNLNTLREREAKWAGSSPIELLNQISDHEQAIALTEQAIADVISLDEFRETLKTLNIDQPQAADAHSTQLDAIQENVTIHGGVHFYGSQAASAPEPEGRQLQAYDLNKVRRLLADVFSEDDLRDFSFYESDFRPVHDQLRDNDRKPEILRRLVEYAWRKDLVPRLLTWARQVNQSRYEQGTPYETEQL